MEIKLSNRGLWHIITGRVSPQHPQQVAEELRQNKDKLLNGILTYKPHSSTSSLDKIKQSENVKDFIKKLSKFMDLDVIQTFELFSNYLHNDFRGTPQQLKQKLKNDSQTEHLMLKILDYYFEERLHILQCVKYLLSYWQDPNHAFREQFMECLNGLQDNNTLITKVMEQYRSCCSAQVQTTQLPSSLEKTRNCKLTLQYLQEQILLLEVMLLHYKDFLHPPDSLLQTVKFFQSQGFGMRQINRHIFDGRAEALIPQISYLQVLVLIESFDLEGLRNHMDDGSFTKHHIVQEPAIIEELDKIFVTWGDLPQHGPIMLAWAVFRYVTMETDQEQAVRRIGSKALQCHVFEYLESMLTFEAFSASSPVAFICKSLVYGLMFIVLGLFQEDTLGDIKLLVSVLSLALMEKGLCIDFWDTNLSAGAGLLLKSAAKWFPLQFSPFLQLLKSLAGEEESAAKVFQYVSCLSSYTEQLRENKIGDVDCIGDDQVWKIITPKVLYKNVYSNEQHIVIDSGTLGALIPNQGSAVVQWSHRYSGWKLFLFEIDSYLQSVSTGTSTEGERVIATVDLINEILKNNWSKEADLGPFISRLHLIVQRCSPSPSPPLGLIASCLRCLATVASHDPLQVWFGLQQTGFLPYCTSAHTSHNQSTVDSIHIAHGNLGAILNAREQPSGHFPVTVATLHLCLQLVCGIGQAHEDVEQPVNFLDLAACVVFVIREVFTGFHKWRFTDVKDREEIGEKCLEIFNAVLGLRLEKSKNESRDEMDWDEVEETRHVIRSASVLPDVLSHALLQSSAGQPLLNILCTGVDTVDRLISLGGSTGSHALAVVQLIKLAFSVLSKLLNRKHKNEEISPLEQALSTQVIQQLKDPRNPTPSSPGQSQLVTVISSYIYHRMDSKLPTLATLLLKRLCLVAPMSMYASFGAEAIPLRDAFVARLKSSKEDLKLKVAILEFIATAVETQPGLIELFLDLNSKRKPHLSLGDHSCLHAVLNIINPIKKAGVHMPSKLVSAAFLLLHALWFDRRDAALTAIRNSPKFWENLTHPLFTDINNEEDSGPQLQTCSYSLQIVAMESYYVASGQLDDSLKTILKDFISKQRYQYWSKFVKLAYPDESVARRSPRPRSPLVSIANDNDHLKLLRSWRTFLVVAATVETSAFSLTDSKLRCEVLEETLSALKSQVSRPVCAEVMTAAHELSALYLVLLRTWKSALRKFNSAFVTLVDVLETANRNDTQLLDHIRSPVFSCISILLQHARSENKSDTLESSYAMALLPLACEPLEYLNGRLGKQNDNSRDRVLELSVFIIDEILNILLSNPGQWLPVLREHALFASLVTALDICVKTREKLEFAEAVLHLFLSLSRIPVSAEALAINNLSQTLCLGIASLFNGLDSDRTAETQVNSRLPPQAPQPGTRPVQQSDSPSHRWTNVWRLSLAVMASMLRTLRFGFLKEVFDFAGVHREQLAQAMDRVRTSQSAPALAEAEEVTELLLELAHFPKQWSFTLPDVLGVLQYRAGVLCQTCIALLTHPRLLAHLLEMSSGNPLHEGSQPLTDISLSLSGSFASRGLLRSYSYADEDSFRNNPVVSSTQSKLLKILCNTLAMLRQFTPDICEILLDEGMDIDEHLPILALVFSSPAIDHEEPLSFGTLLACLNMCLTHMSPGDVRSPAKSPVKTLSETLPKNLLMFAMETALVLALSQATRYLRDPSVDPRVKQLLKRELGSELSTFLGGLNRYFIRRGLPPSPQTERPSPAATVKKTPTKIPVFSEIPEQRLFKLADLYVKRLLR
ncbi:nucleoporin NUP188 isoform X2 [Nematostella vectensis]|uniref:nucleoporin NUP188 isoform X2 n=1 Tax=Nematostella vectensis TaxID=45351 RepID=UPI002076FABB|nr:nucleoporin NUP188 isoform X2 [Nematostella vectensis]